MMESSSLQLRAPEAEEKFVTVAETGLEGDEKGFALVILCPDDGETNHSIEDLVLGVTKDESLEAIILDKDYTQEIVKDWVESQALDAS